MAVFIDPPTWFWRGRRWSHVISDQSLEELHAFARMAGIPWRGFGFDHYDVPEYVVADVVALGATMIDARDVVRKLRRAGLRTTLGKSAKRWVPLGADERLAVLGDHRDTVGAAAQLVGAGEVEIGDARDAGDARSGNDERVDVMGRPSEILLGVVGDRQPSDAELARLRDGFAGLVIRSPWGTPQSTRTLRAIETQWSIELVLPRSVSSTAG